ncbi:ABC transporter ATP-binding protein [Nakamurella antarctica]|uniref:ABC transporter ATP-binding protein n=1 Tax=Nakamurella antarctica TaxID=1902245 RepID=A0A3G9A0K1_9ACTN|nr:ABC transporter ATP-binding protein [Nakamurella antarctica]
MMRAARREPGIERKPLAKGLARRVLTFARPFRRLLAMFTVLVVFAALISVATPLLAGRVVNEITSNGRVSVVVWTAIFIAGLAVVDAVLSYVQRWYSARIGEGLIFKLRSAVFTHIQSMPLAFFTRTQTGALVSRLNNDVLGAQQAFTSTLSGIVSNAVSLVITATVMFTLSWQITALALVLLPVFVFPAKRVGRQLQTITRESYSLNASMNTTMTERFNVSGALLVKLFGRPQVEAQSFSDKAQRVRDIGIRSAMYARALFVALSLVAALAQALVYGLGGYYALTGQLSAGTVVTLALLLSRLYGPLMALSNVRIDVMSALVSFERVFEVLDLPPMVADAPGAVELADATAADVTFTDVRFSYPRAAEVSLASLEDVAVLDQSSPAEVLKGLTFTAHAGQMLALVGHSGAGKTTISQLIPRIYDVRGGAIRIGEQDVRGVTQQSLRDAIGVVSQDAHLFHDTIGANLRYAKPTATDDEIWEALRAANIADKIAELPERLDTLVGDRGYRLSGGEKQRVAIARLLLKSPSIVILDEATAHLDSESEHAVQGALAVALAGRTSIVIAHRLSTIRAAHQVLVIDDGRIVESGTHSDLLELGGAYAELYRTQFAEPGYRNTGGEGGS